MGILLTKRRAVDLCRVAACLCRPVRWRWRRQSCPCPTS